MFGPEVPRPLCVYVLCVHARAPKSLSCVLRSRCRLCLSTNSPSLSLTAAPHPSFSPQGKKWDSSFKASKVSSRLL